MRLNKRITIETPTVVNTNGIVSTTWATVATVSAAVMPQAKGEYYRAKQVHATLSHLVRVRYSGDVDGVTPRDRVILGSRQLNILAAVNLDERGQWLDLACEEVAA